MHPNTSTSALICVLLLSACAAPADDTVSPLSAAYSFTGEPLFAAEPDSALIDRFSDREAAYDANPQDADNIVWHGRFLAYIGRYNEAIDVYTRGIELHPDDARMYRHRGHRYITTRKLDLAISDLEKAAELTEGMENEMEPDGMPNARGIPVSSLQGNIWYHLGLAYYLKHDLPNALRGFSQGLAAGNYADNVVSTSHWIYMIHRRMGNEEAAYSVLSHITADMDIIENFAYHQLLLFYKGELSEEELTGEGSAGDAITYGVGNWHLYNGDEERAREIFADLLSGSGWASFGYIAAESDMLEYFGEQR